MKIEKKIPLFTGEGDEGNMEVLFDVADRLQANACHLHWTDGEELFDGFGECLIDTAEIKWEAVIQGIPPAHRNVARFDQAMRAYYQQFALTDDPRDVLMDNIKMWKKPRAVKVTDHVNRIETVIGYANRLEGNRPPAQADEIKQILFDGFPNHWKQEFLTSRRTVQDATKDQIWTL
jgi:hypothetical protein